MSRERVEEMSMSATPPSQSRSEERPEKTASSSDPLDDLDFASDSGFVGVIEEPDADRVEDCVEPG